MADKYNWKFIDMVDLDNWLVNNQEIVNRCTFNSSWRWINKGSKNDYVDAVNIHLHELPIHKDYDIRSNESFFRTHEVGKTIGHWQGELFHEIGELLRDKDIQTSSVMNVHQGCYVYSKYGSIELIKQIAHLIETHFGLFTRIHREGKSDYSIYIHNDKSILNSLELKEPEKARKRDEIHLQSDDQTELKNREIELLAELAKIQTKLKQK
jgi:hypothetical protein